MPMPTRRRSIRNSAGVTGVPLVLIRPAARFDTGTCNSIYCEPQSVSRDCRFTCHCEGRGFFLGGEPRLSVIVNVTQNELHRLSVRRAELLFSCVSDCRRLTQNDSSVFFCSHCLTVSLSLF